ncbi:MAG: NFACT RNA binding domain-containing protein [Candidatus Woesearchaeota archaeon]|nr:NFACT RNA binding domain-containing protein [Candidatus Woesearchaeota archaeon]
MRIILDSNKTVDQNAVTYFERAKKAKKKLKGAREALEKTKANLIVKKEKKQQEKKVERKKDWYEKFRWFISSENILCVGGKDAGTNEEVVKKHADKEDTVFHTDMAGSPFVIVKGGTEKTLEEAAIFTASFSRAWKQGMGFLDVFYVKPEQLSKTANPGEFLGKGAFMVRGKTQYMKPQLGLVLGKEDSGRVMIGPERAVLSHTGEGYQIRQGKKKTSDVAKELAKKLDVHPDEIIPLLPPGGVTLGRKVKILRTTKE